VLEIGSSLREVRIRRGVELAQVEAETHIRTRYLKALEDERFDLMPGDAYVRGFLHTYADYLELDGELFVDEYKARFAPPEEPLPQLIPRRQIGLYRLPARGTVGAVLVVALVATVAWRLDAGGGPTNPAPSGAPALRKEPPASVARRTPRKARPATLVLTAAQGPCWLSVRLGSRAGRNLHEGHPRAGAIAPFRRKASLDPARRTEQPRGEPEGRAGEAAGGHGQRRRDGGGCAHRPRRLVPRMTAHSVTGRPQRARALRLRSPHPPWCRRFIGERTRVWL
jgi:Helix-turn-helix domain